MTVMTDLIHNSKTVVAVKPQSVVSAQAVVGEVIDTQGFYSMLLQVALGDGSSTKVKVTDIEEDDAMGMGSAKAVPETQIIGALKVDNDKLKTVQCINIVPTKRYVRVKLYTGGSNALISANATLFGADVNGDINA